MMNAFCQINWLAVALATFAFSAFGALWFTLLVPKYYVIALGRENAPKHEQAPSDYLVQVLCTFSTTLTSALLSQALNIQTIESALVFGAVVGIGYQVAMTFNIAINPNFPRPVLYGLLNTPFFLLGSLMVNVIFVCMK